MIVCIVDQDERVLLLRRPDLGGWQPVAGAVEAGETVLQAAQREVSEEVGQDVRVTPIGVARAWTFRFDDVVTHMMGVAWVMAYEGGEVAPRDDMAGGEWGWFTLDEIIALQIVMPGDAIRVFERALQPYRTYPGDAVDLDPYSA